MVETKTQTEALIKRHLFTVEDYLKMGEVGILHEDSPVELIEGEIIEMSPIGRRHKATVDRINDLFAPDLHNRAIVRIQSSIRLSRRSEPEPDVAVLRYRADFYEESDAGPEDVLLIIEIADSSLAYDREVKTRLYARYGIPELWIGDVNGKVITGHTDPGPDGYRTVKEYRGDDRLSPLAFPDLVLTVKQILG